MVTKGLGSGSGSGGGSESRGQMLLLCFASHAFALFALLFEFFSGFVESSSVRIWACSPLNLGWMN